MQLTKTQFIDLAMDLGRFCRTHNGSVRAAIGDMGNAYAFPGEPRSDYADQTLANFDFSHDGEKAVRDFLENIQIVEEED
jgi:hypothetical protein